MRLSDILAAGGGNDDLRRLWNETTAADEFGPLPAGEYVAHVVAGELATSKSNATPGYTVTFKVIEGPHVGRLFWLSCWLTPAALPQSKRDLAKLGVRELSQLEQPLPRWIRCKCKLTVRRDDDGAERNRLRSFEAVGIDPPDDDPFAPGAVVKPPTKPLPTLSGAVPLPTFSEGGNGDAF